MASNLNVTELDFDQIKQNLKNYLKQQTEFNDYDFDGSGLNVLLDVLAYNTHYNAVAAHYSLNESFLDSAQIRGNVTTRAKLLGYTPRSILSSRAKVTIVVDISGESALTQAETDNLTLSRGTKLTTTVSGETYQFVVLNTQTVTKGVGQTFTFTDVEIAEGSYKSLYYRVDNDIENQKFILGDTDADTSTLRVRVKQNQDSTTHEIYTRFESLLNVDSTSQVYYLQENPNERYEVYFGDGTIGKKPQDNNIIVLDYVYTNGPDANGASTFSMAQSIGGFNTITVTTTSNSAGGTEKETLESIRFNAPLTFTSQNRAVTADDYRAIILKNFSNIGSISTWGGEDNDPIDYGKVYICIKPLTASVLTTAERTNITNTVLKGKNIVSITPEIVDPNFTDLELDVLFKFNPNLTDRTKVDLASVVRDTISDYNFNNLNKFDGVFRHSALLKLIDASDPSILNSTVRPYMFKTIAAKQAAVNNNFTLTFASPFFESGSSTDFLLSSTAFAINGVDHFFGDVPITGSSNRTVIVYKKQDGKNVIVLNDCGLIEPSTGRITLHSFSLDVDTTIKLSITPNSLDIAPKRDQLLNIDQTYVSITPEIDTIATAGSTGSITYTTSSRLR